MNSEEAEKIITEGELARTKFQGGSQLSRIEEDALFRVYELYRNFTKEVIPGLMALKEHFEKDSQTEMSGKENLNRNKLTRELAFEFFKHLCPEGSLHPTGFLKIQLKACIEC